MALLSGPLSPGHYLREVFKLDAFRNNQEAIINCTLSGQDCFALLPTGGGKSLCYQLPAVMEKGFTLVVSPLKALINDQLCHLKQLNIHARSLDSSKLSLMFLSAELKKSVFSLKLVFVSPEFLIASGSLKKILDVSNKQRLLKRIVFDEAHCVSEWGDQFRPAYRKLHWLRNSFPNVPFMALTASADAECIKDVVQKLGLINPIRFVSSFDRPNLKINVVACGASPNLEIVTTIASSFHNVCGLVYCFSKKDCVSMTQSLVSAGLSAKTFHADIPELEKMDILKCWKESSLKIVVCTIAFGLGINKSDVRFVIHHSMPCSMSAYYQEIGRAGRDGLPSTCILFYDFADFTKKYCILKDSSPSRCPLPFPQERKKDNMLVKLCVMAQFCEEKIICRRQMVMGSFGEAACACGDDPMFMCDLCSHQERGGSYLVECQMFLKHLAYKWQLSGTDALKHSHLGIDVSGTCQLMQHVIASSIQTLTVNQLVDVLRGSSKQTILKKGLQKLPLYGTFKAYPVEFCERVVHTMVFRRFLAFRSVRNSAGYSTVCLEMGPSKMTTSDQLLFLPPLIKADDCRKVRDDPNVSCFEDLTYIVSKMAYGLGVAEPNIFPSESLHHMSLDLPCTLEDFLKIPFVTRKRYYAYADAFTDCIKEYKEGVDEECDDDLVPQAKKAKS